MASPSTVPGPSRDAAPLTSCRLERGLGKPRAAWGAPDLVAAARAEGVRLVSLMHVGGDGWLKTLDFAPRSEAHLRDVLEGGERADGSSLFPGNGIRAGASDVLLRPRLASAFLEPFAEHPTLAVLCGHADRDGAPLDVSPDTIVRRAHARMLAETGADLHALGEVEYFVGRRATDADAYGADDRAYHASSPFVFGEALRRDALRVLAEIGVPTKYAHAEVGYIPAADADGAIWEQHEVEMALAPLPEAADAVVLAHWVLRNLAHRRGMRVSFDPILRRGHAGSGLHFHLSPVVAGAHAGRVGPDGRLSDAARWVVAGLVRAGTALMAFGNRAPGSFVRLEQGKEAPTAVAWGEADRLALIRIPVTVRATDGREVTPPTVEFRLPDGSAHPHLLLAGIAQAAVAGRAEGATDEFLEASRSARVRLERGQAPRLPRTMTEVADALVARRAVLEAGGVFPAAFLDRTQTALRG